MDEILEQLDVIQETLNDLRERIEDLWNVRTELAEPERAILDGDQWLGYPYE